MSPHQIDVSSVADNLLVGRNIRNDFDESKVHSAVSDHFIPIEINSISWTLLTRNVVSELYYSDTEITEKQENVKEAVKIICCKLEVDQWQLGVMSSVKGLLAGRLKIFMPDNVIIDCSLHNDGLLLPLCTPTIERFETDAKYILLVEKDTVFKKLVEYDISKHFGAECILITVNRFESNQPNYAIQCRFSSALRTGQRVSGHHNSYDFEKTLGFSSIAHLRLNRCRSARHRNNAHISTRFIGDVKHEWCIGRARHPMDWHIAHGHSWLRYEIDSDDWWRSSQIGEFVAAPRFERQHLQRIAIVEIARQKGGNRRTVWIVQWLFDWYIFARKIQPKNCHLRNDQVPTIKTDRHTSNWTFVSFEHLFLDEHGNGEAFLSLTCNDFLTINAHSWFDAKKCLIGSCVIETIFETEQNRQFNAIYRKGKRRRERATHTNTELTEHFSFWLCTIHFSSLLAPFESGIRPLSSLSAHLELDYIVWYVCSAFIVSLIFVVFMPRPYLCALIKSCIHFVAERWTPFRNAQTTRSHKH